MEVIWQGWLHKRETCRLRNCLLYRLCACTSHSSGIFRPSLCPPPRLTLDRVAGLMGRHVDSAQAYALPPCCAVQVALTPRHTWTSIACDDASHAGHPRIMEQHPDQEPSQIRENHSVESFGPSATDPKSVEIWLMCWIAHASLSNTELERWPRIRTQVKLPQINRLSDRPYRTFSHALVAEEMGLILHTVD